MLPAKQYAKILVGLIFLFQVSISAYSQNRTAITLPMQFNYNFESNVISLISFNEARQGKILPVVCQPGESKIGKARGNVLVLAERLIDDKNAYKITVDTDGDGEFTGESEHIILPDSSIIVEVLRKWENASQKLPYIISYSRRIPGRGWQWLSNWWKGKVSERLSWTPRYCRQGLLSVDSCQTLFIVTDLYGDGIFDIRDADLGTNLGLDRNNDGKIWGRDEWIRGHEIIDYCNKSYLLDSLASDGSYATLRETELKIARIKEEIPPISLTTINGREITSEHLKGKITLLDFWASWCKPCVEKFPTVKKIASDFEGKIEIIAINVDVTSRLDKARKVIDDYQLPWPHVMTGKGNADPVWKIFGSMENSSLSIPWYVLIDEENVIRYAGHGEENLSDLSEKIEQLVKAEN